MPGGKRGVLVGRPHQAAIVAHLLRVPLTWPSPVTCVSAPAVLLQLFEALRPNKFEANGLDEIEVVVEVVAPLQIC